MVPVAGERKIVHAPGHGHGHGGEHGHGHGDEGAHGHGDEGAHGHGHVQGHAHAGGEASRNQAQPLERGAGTGKLLFFDTPSGIAGDMTIAALVDLGVPWAVVEAVPASLGLEGVELIRTQVVRGAIGATHVKVSFPQDQPERSYRQIVELLQRSTLSEPVLALSLAIFRRLAEAEAEVHRIPIDTVAFHEVGAVDAIIDIVGAAACLSYVGAEVLCSPLPMGTGSVTCRHGVLPLPAPATVNCLVGVPTYDAGVVGELVTPTGAAIVATISKQYVRWPDFTPERVGWGAGTRSLADRPNALRVALGARVASEAALSHVLVEATVDDMTGELVGHALARLLEAGAVDAWVTSVTMKKGRPGWIVTALSRGAQAGAVADAMLRHTSTIGVRFTTVTRRELSRRMLEVATEYGPIAVKVSGGEGEPLKLKPEFDACARAARAHGVPVRAVLDAAVAAARGSVGTF